MDCIPLMQMPLLGTGVYGVIIRATADFAISSSTTRLGNPTSPSATRLTIDPSGNVGIGTNAPSKTLDVRGDIWLGASGTSILGSYGDMHFYVDNAKVIEMWTSGSDYIFKSHHDDMRFPALGTGGMTLGSNTSPSTILTIYQPADDKGIKIYGYDDVVARYAELFVNSAGYTILKSSTDRGLVLKGHAIDFYISSGGTQIGRWTYSGNLGVGVIDPEKRLEVKSDTTYDGILIDVLSAPEIVFRDRGNSDTKIGTGRHGLDDFYIDTYSGNAFAIDGATRNVGIGNTAPAYRLEVTGSATGDWIVKDPQHRNHQHSVWSYG